MNVGDQVGWTYQLTNTGNMPLRWSVSDDVEGEPACPRLLYLFPGRTIFCHAPGVAQAGQYANTGSVQGTTPSGGVVTDSDPSHYFGLDAAIELEKLTNGFDADQPPGPFVALGGAVTWTYRVTNTGNGPLTDVGVVDLRGVIVTCPQTTLAVDESIDCSASGTASAGQYTNQAVTTGSTELGERVSDNDPSNHFGADPGIHLEKSTNGDDADEAPGPLIPVGDPVDWAYQVFNTGNNTLTGVAVTDDHGVTITCPTDELAPREDMTCTATGTATLGNYENTASVTATDTTGATVADDDPSHYFGWVSRIDVEKLTNGEDPDQPTGPALTAGGPVTWTYLVSNPGNLPIRNVTLVDDHGVQPQFTGGDTDSDRELDPGETWSYQATGTAGAGQYANTATASGVDVLEHPLSDSDPSHYVSPMLPPPLQPPLPPPQASQPANPRLILDKRATRQRLRAGDHVRFRLRVRNTGRATARRVRVCDHLPAGLTYTGARGARIQGRRACFTLRKLSTHRSRTFIVDARTKRTPRSRRICNLATRAAQGVRLRSARACVRVLPSRQRRPPRVTG